MLSFQKDALTVRRTEFPFSPSSWQEKDFLAPWRNSRPNNSSIDGMSVTSADRLGFFRRASPAPSLCSSLSATASNSASRLASAPTGSLIVFRVHSAITDDAQSLVEYLTILLSEGAFEEAKSIPSSTVNIQEPGTLITSESEATVFILIYLLIFGPMGTLKLNCIDFIVLTWIYRSEFRSLPVSFVLLFSWLAEGMEDPLTRVFLVSSLLSAPFL